MRQFVVAVDVGTSTIRACLYGDKCQLVTSCQKQMEVIVSGQDEWELRVEIDPQTMWKLFIEVVKEVLIELPPDSKVSMAICCQRNSFLFWRKSDGQTLTRIVCWNDARARRSCDEWNSSMTIKALNTGGALLHFFTRRPQFKAASVLQFLSAMVSHRALVTIDTNPELQQELKNKNLAFGCLDTWLIYQLSVENVICAEISNTSSTGLFDPFIKDYNRTILRLLSFPIQILAPLVDSAGDSGSICTVKKTIFDRTIDVVAMLADQQSALYGSGGWNVHDVKISLGTGSFVDMNTGDQPHASIEGLYPLVGWSLNGKTTYVAEGNDHDTAVLLKWAQQIGLFDDISKTSDMAFDVGSSNGLVFVPAFGGLQTPINDGFACCSFMGIRPDTTKEHMVRAILESIAFRVYQIFETMKEEVHLRTNPRIRICGGVAANDFICQTIADLISLPIERIEEAGLVASKGVALIAGVRLGMWKEEHLHQMISIQRTFKPNPNSRLSIIKTYNLWLKAVKRSCRFY